MKRINLIIDKNLSVKLPELESQLNKHSNFLEFYVYNIDLEIEDGLIIFPETHQEIYNGLTEEEKSSYFNFLVTDVPYINNYFFEGYDNLVPFSIYGWNHLTNLPIENGILYFSICYLARQLENEEFRHQESTGCIYDFLGDKRGIDDGMRQASFCKSCLEKLEKQVLSDEDEKLLANLIELMNFLSISSKWNKNIVEKASKNSNGSVPKRTALEEGVINVVIASPGDLIEERELLLNRLERKFRIDQHEELCNHRLLVHGWEDLASQSGYAQNIINEHIISKMDIVVALFKHKLGTPTIEIESGKVRSPSGTAEELLIALNNKKLKGPFGMSYFYSKPPAPSFDSPNFNNMLEEWIRLKEFKNSIREKLIYKPFINKDELIEMVSEDLMKNIRHLFEIKST